MIAIDSNIWCYYFDESCKEHSKIAEAVERALAKERILLNTIIVMEVSHFLVKNLGPSVGKEKIEIFLSLPMTILDLTFSSLHGSIELLCAYSHEGSGGRDATVLDAMKRAGINKIMTHDQAFKKIDWLEVIDPLA